MQEVGQDANEVEDPGLLARVLYCLLRHSTQRSSFLGRCYNDELASVLLNELQGVRDRIVEEDLSYG